MKRYGLYWLRAITLGAGLNAIIVSNLMTHKGWKFHQAAPVGGPARSNFGRCQLSGQRSAHFWRATRQKCVK